jgi:hypothetical protein
MHALMYTGEGQQEGLLAVANIPPMLLTPAPANTTRHTWLDCCSLLGRHTQAILAGTLRRIPSQQLAAPQYSIMQPKERHTMVTTPGSCMAGGRLSIGSHRDNHKVSYQVSMTVSQWLASNNTPPRQSYTSGCLIKGTRYALHGHSTASLQHSHNLQSLSIRGVQTLGSGYANQSQPSCRCCSATALSAALRAQAAWHRTGDPCTTCRVALPGTDKQAVAAVLQQQYSRSTFGAARNAR